MTGCASKMSFDTFDVLEFSADSLYESLSNRYVAASEVQRRRRARYLFRYLKELGAKTIVVEKEYTDGDYLDDYAAYYVRCFEPYDRRCKRLHFFRRQLSTESFLELVRGSPLDGENGESPDSYLGFVVARPLPQAIVGRTALRTWESDGGRRQYLCTREYKANLFGTELSVSSLAFQEQDTVLAACATVSLWSCFQKTAELFGTPTPTPAAITRAASLTGHYGRPIPSHGLVVTEICRAITEVGLEPEVFDVKPKTPLLSLVYGYLMMGLPVILGVEVQGGAGHAITLAGFSIQTRRHLNQEVAPNSLTIPMKGLHIDGLFGHDDQLGPFSKLKVKTAASVGQVMYPVWFESIYDPSDGTLMPLYPRVVIVPVYHKIRITFIDVQEWLTRLTQVLRLVLPTVSRATTDPSQQATSTTTPDYEWDIYLSRSNDYKRMIRAGGMATDPQWERLLLAQQPRFIWRAVLALSGTKMVELLFDATDISRSLAGCRIIWHHKQFASLVKTVITAPAIQPVLIDVLTELLWNRLKESLEKNA